MSVGTLHSIPRSSHISARETLHRRADDAISELVGLADAIRDAHAVEAGAAEVQAGRPAREELDPHHPLDVADERLRVRPLEAEHPRHGWSRADPEQRLEVGAGERNEVVVAL